jgi:hypothetical protein
MFSMVRSFRFESLRSPPPACWTERTYRADELHLDASVLQSLAILWSDCHLSRYRLSIHIQGRFLAAVLVELDVHHLPVVRLIQDNVDIDRSREEVRHVGPFLVESPWWIGYWTGGCCRRLREANCVRVRRCVGSSQLILEPGH